MAAVVSYNLAEVELVATAAHAREGPITPVHEERHLLASSSPQGTGPQLRGNQALPHAGLSRGGYGRLEQTGAWRAREGGRVGLTHEAACCILVHTLSPCPLKPALSLQASALGVSGNAGAYRLWEACTGSLSGS